MDTQQGLNKTTKRKLSSCTFCWGRGWVRVVWPEAIEQCEIWNAMSYLVSCLNIEFSIFTTRTTSWLALFHSIINAFSICNRPHSHQKETQIFTLALHKIMADPSPLPWGICDSMPSCTNKSQQRKQLSGLKENSFLTRLEANQTPPWNTQESAKTKMILNP